MREILSGEIYFLCSVHIRSNKLSAIFSATIDKIKMKKNLKYIYIYVIIPISLIERFKLSLIKLEIRVYAINLKIVILKLNYISLYGR